MPVYKDKKRNTWYFQIRKKDIYGNVKQITRRGFKGREEAKDAEAVERLKKDKIHKTKVKDMVQLYLKDYKSSHKESSYYGLEKLIDTYIVKYFPNTYADDLTINHIHEWQSIISSLQHNGKPYSLKYKNKIRITFFGILSYGVSYCGLARNVISLCKGFKEPNDEIKDEEVRYITPNEFYSFIGVIDDLVWKSFFSFLFWMGCRKGEAQALTWNDINFDTLFVRINKTLSVKTENKGYKITNTKNRKNRTILMTDQLNKIMIDLYNMYSTLDGFSKNWFVFGGVRPLAQTNIDRNREHYYNLVDNKIKPQKFNRITNHEFRHSHASVLISHGVSISRIAERLGDTEEVILKTYAHLFPSTQKEVVNLLNNM